MEDIKEYDSTLHSTLYIGKARALVLGTMMKATLIP